VIPARLESDTAYSLKRYRRLKELRGPRDNEEVQRLYRLSLTPTPEFLAIQAEYRKRATWRTSRLNVIQSSPAATGQQYLLEGDLHYGSE
jgi:hypothetical protein